MPKAIILRLESYLTYLAQLKREGKTNATSEELAALFGISSSRVRQDLLALGVSGRPRAGYDIDNLRSTIVEELDLCNIKPLAIVGLGNLGRALARSDIWTDGGFDLRAAFDSDPALIGTEVRSGLKVRNTTELFGVIKSESIVAACITVPAASAQPVTDLLVTAGVTGIWNFSPIEINVPEQVAVENQRLEQGLMTLSYKMSTISN